MTVTRKRRMEVLLSGDCFYCGGIPDQVDHMIPVSRGGTDDWVNLVPACKRCNMEKLDFTPEEYKQYRLEHGLGWPPKSQEQFLRELLAQLREQYGDEFVSGVISRLLHRRANADPVP